MIIHNTFVKRNRATPFLLAAFAPFLLSGQSVLQQGEGVPCRSGPLVKNIMAINTPPCSTPPTAASRELTKKEVKELTKAPTSRRDYLKLSGYHQARADRFEAESVAYDKAAATYRERPTGKNLMAPNTVARFEQFAGNLHEQAKAELARAVSDKQMAENAAQGSSLVSGQ
jgi:hypothetical protein